ncbi:hypothetical protein LOY89_005450 [Ophidiomyces ophidiicola]|nr:hypothetical protein LOY89_005450 [Ophidiomyces ophidiicola]
MRDIILWSLAAAATVLQITQALELVKRSSPAVIGFEIERRKVPILPESDDRRVRRQSKVVSQVLDNKKTLYFCNLTLGTPPQKLQMHIDTGSSDLWVNTPSSKICQDRRNLCQAGGTYDPKKSSTHKRINSNFNITYADGSSAVADYVSDKINVGGISLEDFQFAVGYQSTSREGVLGIGYPTNEVQAVRNREAPYANLPKALVDGGLIKSNAYSIWLNDLDSNTGEILFGGVNKAKFEGSLKTLPVIRNRGTYKDLAVALTGLAVNSGSGTQQLPSANFPFSAVLDTGSSLTYLPDAIVSDIFDAVSAQWDPESGAAYVPCSLAGSKSKFVFSFSEPKISVDMDEMVINPGPGSNGEALKFDDGTLACIFGIAPSQHAISILGDTFIRSAYVVYDLDNDEISLAQTRFNTSSNDILEIGTGKGSVPDATAASGAVSSAPRTATATVQTTLTPIATSGSNAGVRPVKSTAGAVPTAKPEYPIGMIAGLAGAGLVFAAM